MEVDINKKKEDIKCFKEEEAKFQIPIATNECIQEKSIIKTKENTKKEKISIIFNNLIKDKIIFKQRLVLLHNLIILYFVISFFNVVCDKRKFYSKDSFIIIKINKVGESNILSDIFYHGNFIKEIYINNNYANLIKKKYNLNETENIIKIFFNDGLSSTGSMFYFCYNITEIDLTNLNTSLVTNMHFMFYGCSSLVSVNLSNINTSLVNNMGGCFMIVLY